MQRERATSAGAMSATRPAWATNAMGAAIVRRRGWSLAGALLLAALSHDAYAATAADGALPGYSPAPELSGSVSSMGDHAMQSLMDAWLAAFQAKQPRVRRGSPWQHTGAPTAFGALMFELADMAPLARDPTPAELAPYAHQFAGDMMKSPLLLQVAGVPAAPAYLALNKRPGAPLPATVTAFVNFVLSRDGQAIVAQQGRFPPLSAQQAATERAKLEGFIAPLDPGLAPYHATARVKGVISSVGSDGMKTLMERWMRDFRRVQPGVGKGERWEHLGTLNGFHALIVDETDLAPMGRELWPEERAAYAATHHQMALFEIRVARGGFNTPQRTTAQAIFVHESNPLSRISVPQLTAILGAPQTITRWGQLGLTGEWADRPLTVYMPPKVAPNAMSMQIMVLKGGAWSEVHEGSIADTAAAIAGDPGAIGFGGFEEGGPHLKTLAVAAHDGGPFYQGDAASTASGRYPLTRYLYIRLTRPPGKALSAPVKEFLRYILSREGQEPILYSAYFPLTAKEAREELAKLE